MATRKELFAKLGYTKPVVKPILNAAFENEEEQIWRDDLQSSPHGQHWHLSFHASGFPGDNPKACGRQAIYSLMNIPSFHPVSRAGRSVMEAGKAIEEIVVWRLHRSGLLLTDPPDAEHQMGFEDKEHWLTGSPDAIILNPKDNSPYPVEIKSKDGAVIEDMQQGGRSFDPAHRTQALTYIGLSKDNKESLWPELNDVTSGSILYVSRDRPDQDHEFKFEYNESFMKQGYEKLSSWKNSYLNEELPQTQEKKHPFGWKWTQPPCKWCPVKKVCKADFQGGITSLNKSNGIKHAKDVRGNYDYTETRNAVLERWDAD
jgi:hypothetical protein